MGFTSRLMTAIRAGVATFRQGALIPNQNQTWDELDSRFYRYALGDLYYSNAIYKALNDYAAISAARKVDSDLYKRIRGVYNPVYRLVESYVSKVYGGQIDLDNLETGAFPVRNADDNLRALLRQQMLYCNWRANKSLYVRQGKKFGDVFLKVVDNTDLGRSYPEIVEPGKVKDFEKDSNGRIQQIIFEYERLPDNEVYKPNDNTTKPKAYLYTEIITNESFAYYADSVKVDEYENPYGFVPVRHVLNRDEGLDWGATDYNNSLDKIDELNDQASLLNDAVRKNSDISWLMIGLSKPDNKTVFSSDARDDIKGMFVPGASPAEVDAKPLTSPLAIADAIANITQLQAEIERDMPELAMHHLRDSAQQTAPGIRAAYNDAVDKFQEAQGVYDGGAVDGFNMSLVVSGIRGYKGYEKYSLEMLLDGGMEWYVNPRPIIDDELSKQDKITAFISSKAPSRWIWKELGIADSEIKVAEAEAEARRQAMMDAANFDVGGNTDNGDGA